MSEKIFNIKTASILSGVSPYNIRSWEKRYLNLTPQKDKAGNRVYSKYDIDKFSCLSKLIDNGFKISKLVHYNLDELTKLLQDIDPKAESSNSRSTIKDTSINTSLVLVFFALKNYQLNLITKEIEKLLNKLNLRDVVFKVIIPLMSEVGAAVSRGEFSISHEHALSSIIKYYMNRAMYRTSENKNYKNKYSKRIIIAGIENDFHEFGILSSALLAIYYHHEVIYLGPNLPVDSLLDVSASLEIDQVILGISSYSAMYNKTFVEKNLQRLSLKLNPNIKLIVGGITATDNSQISYLPNLELLDKWFLN